MSNLDRQFILAVSGSRSIANPLPVHELLAQLAFDLMSSARSLELRLGDAAGVDAHALSWARTNSVPRHICFADRRKWDRWRAELQAHATLPAHVQSIRLEELSGRVLFRDGSWESAELAADWERDGLTLAGSKRNAAMLYGHPRYGSSRDNWRADRLLAVHDGVSSGTWNCIRQAELMDIEVQYEVVIV